MNPITYGTLDLSKEYLLAIEPLPEVLGKNGSVVTSSTASVQSTSSETMLEPYVEETNAEESDEELEGVDCISFVCHLLGFTRNPLNSSRHHSRSRNSSAADLRLAMLSNFSTAYNVISISLAFHMMQNVYPNTETEASLCSSALVGGMIIGQLVGGTLGDVLGRHMAMTVVILLQVIAALMSALSGDISVGGSRFSILIILAFWRFVLGIGAGGVYPLSATITSESSQTHEEKSKTVALAFSMQGVGYLVVPVTALMLVTLMGENSDYAWRILLGLGALPGFLLTVLRVRRLPVGKAPCPPKRTIKNADILTPDDVNAEELRSAPVSILDAILIEPGLSTKLLGTGGCWFLFDILFYGNTLFQPKVLSAAFGAAETVSKAARDTILIACIALPGYIVSIAAVGQQSPRHIQLQGFVMIGLLYAFIGFFFDALADYRWLMMTLYSLTFFWSNYGPNATTFMIPSMTFSRACRSTLNGVCAACGKVGALLGTMLFVPVAARFGDELVMISCAVISVLGFALTWLCIPEELDADKHNEQILRRMNWAERLRVEQRLNRTPMKIVYSNPSLLDCHDEV